MNDEMAHQMALASKVLKSDILAIVRAMMAGEIAIRLTESQAALVRESLRFTMENFRRFPYRDEQTRRERMAEARTILAILRAAKAAARDEGAS